MIPPLPSETARDDLSSRRGVSPAPPPYTPSPRAAGSTYVPSRDGDLANDYDASAPKSFNDRYTRQNAVGDVYTRRKGNLDQDRSELFSGYNPEKAGSGRFFNEGRSSSRDLPPEEGGEEDVEGIKQDLRFTKQESVMSTRNALRLAREAEETALGTLTKLGNQSGTLDVAIRITEIFTNLTEKLANTERHLDISKGYSARAADKTDELKQLNRSIFRPVITFNKDGKRAAEAAKVQQRYDEERAERERAMLDTRQTQDRLGRAAGYGRQDDEGIAGAGAGSQRIKTQAQMNLRKEQRKRYQFEATASDDELEDELDGNLDEIHDVTKRLKAMGTAMGQELDQHIDRISRITSKADDLDNKIFTNTQAVCFYWSFEDF